MIMTGTFQGIHASDVDLGSGVFLNPAWPQSPFNFNKRLDSPLQINA